MAFLRVLKGREPGRIYRLPLVPAVVGRHDSCDLVIEDARASRQHACFRIHGDAWQVRDLGTENGTLLNGEKIGDWTDVRTGGRVRIGHTVLEFHEGEAPPVAAASAPVAPSASDDRPVLRPVVLPPPLPERAPKTPSARPAPPAPASSSPASKPPAADAVPGLPSIPGCRITGVIGRGATGTVYVGRQEALQREIAVKVLDPFLAAQPGQVEQFLAEARATAAISHPNVIPILDVGEHGGLRYFTMEYMRGGTLDDRIRAAGGGGIPWREAVRIVSAAARGLGHIHARGLVHRDVKPANVLLGLNGEVKLGDLGTIVHVDAAAAQRIGTPHFMSPEQAQRKPVTRASDVYSLGVTLYHALSGRLPHSGRDVREIVANVAAGGGVPIESVRSGLPGEVVAVVGELMSRDPMFRPTDADAVARRLAAALEEVHVAREDRRRTNRVRRASSSWMLALSVLAVIGVVWLALSDRISAGLREFTGGGPPPLVPAGGSAGGTPGGQPGSVPAAKPLPRDPQTATEFLLVHQSRARELGEVTKANATEWSELARAYGRLAAEFPLDDPSVRIAADESRRIPGAVVAVTGADAALMKTVDLRLAKSLSASATDRPADVSKLSAAALRAEFQTLTSAAAGRMAKGDHVGAIQPVIDWATPVCAAAAAPRVSPEIPPLAADARSWIRFQCGRAYTALTAELAFDREVLRGQFAMASPFHPRRRRVDAATEPDFTYAIAHAARIREFVGTYLATDRVAEREATLAAQRSAWAAVKHEVTPVSKSVTSEAWRDAVAAAIIGAFDKISPVNQWGALSLLLETGRLDQADSVLDAHKDLLIAKGHRLNAELAARREHARYASAVDPAWREKALRDWVVLHAATDASLLLADAVKDVDLLTAHPVFNVRETDQFYELWGVAPAGSGPR